MPLASCSPASPSLSPALPTGCATKLTDHDYERVGRLGGRALAGEEGDEAARRGGGMRRVLMDRGPAQGNEQLVVVLEEGERARQ